MHRKLQPHPVLFLLKTVILYHLQYTLCIICLQLEIYLKVLEFDSVNSVKFDDIKVQYKKLAKKYHPDSITGDVNRFKLVTDAYEYLQENYPE